MNGKAVAILLVVLGALIWARQGMAEPPEKKLVDPKDALGVLSEGNSTDALAGTLRRYLIKSLPDPLFEDNKHWDLREVGPLGKLKKEGQWYRVKVWGLNLPDTLVLDLREVEVPEPGRKTFTLFVAFDANAELERQHWKRGLRLYSGSTRARFRVKVALHCEAINRTESKGKLIPELVFRLRVVQADLRYDNLVVEHTAGVGGELAKVLGDAFVSTMRQVKPSLERHLLEKANAAIVKAGDTQEVRISVLNLLGGKNEAKPKQGEEKPSPSTNSHHLPFLD